MSYAESVTSTPGSSQEVTQTAHDDKNKKNMIKSLISWYRKAKEYAKTYTETVNSVSDLLYASYCLMSKWQEISNETKWLMNTNPFNGDFSQQVENLEAWMRVSDKILFVDLGDVALLEDNVGLRRQQMINHFKGTGNKQDSTAKIKAAQAMQGYMQQFGMTYNPSPDLNSNGKAVLNLSSEMEHAQQVTQQSAIRISEQIAVDDHLAQQTAAVKAASQDAANQLINSKTATGIRQRTDIETRQATLQANTIQLENRVEHGINEALTSEALALIDSYNRQGMFTTAIIGGFMVYVDYLRDTYPGYKIKPQYVPWFWQPENNNYTNAYQYDGTIYTNK